MRRVFTSSIVFLVMVGCADMPSNRASQDQQRNANASAKQPSAAIVLANLRCEYLVDPLGIDEPKPRLSWSMSSKERGQKQTGYQIQVAGDPALLAVEQCDLWNTGKVNSDQSIQIVYAGKPLASGTAAYWRVRVWDSDGKPSAWSQPACWSMGLLKPSDWSAKWIGLDETPDPESTENDLKKAKWIWAPGGNPAQAAAPGKRFFRRTVTIPKDRRIERATCAISADNGCVLWVNGQHIGWGHSMKTGSCFDVTDMLHPGENVLAVSVTNAGETDNPAGLIVSLRVTFETGEPMIVTSDIQWRTSEKKPDGWNKPGFDDSDWVNTQEIGPFGMQPWGALSLAKSEHTRLPARMLRREFIATAKVKRATVYICGLGYYELHLNGSKVGDHVLDPGLTDYSKRVLYATYDVTDRLKSGDNAIGVMLGNSRFFAPRIGYPFATQHYGYPKCLLQMQIEHEDGSATTLVSDETWKLTSNGPIRTNNDYDGEEYDARMEQTGWNRPGFDDSHWQQAPLVDPPGGVLAAQMLQPMRVTQTIQPIGMTKPKPGTYVYDMGQNMVGWVQIKVEGPKGTRVRMRFAETVNDDGTINVANMRSARVTDIYILKGDGVEIYEPRFTYHGFRYVELEGYPGSPNLETIEGKVIHTDAERVGRFWCSNELINKIYKNILWGVRGNLRSIPTDCPQRDERHGWLGDIANEAKSESFDLNMAPFFAKWMTDIQDSQREDGCLPDVAPAFWAMYNADVTWPSTYVIIPGWYYEQYGDTRILEKHYPSMVKWIDFMSQFVEDGIISKDMYGDWCVPPESPELIHSKDPARATAKPLLATSYLYHDIRLVAHYATILGKEADAKRLNALAETLLEAFNKKYFDPKIDQYDNGTQTSSVLPLRFGMVPAGHEKGVFENLVKNIMVDNKGHIATGLIGAQWLMRTLCNYGRPDVAYTIATQEDYPSWGYMIKNDATTVWELWNGNTADPGMNSHNHLMLIGDLGLWFYEYLGGIRTDPNCPGFKHIILKPLIVGDFENAGAMHRSMYGMIYSEWEIADGTFRYHVEVPVNTTATLYMPAKVAESVRESGQPASKAPGVSFLRSENVRAVFELESGSYTFTAPWQ